MSGKIAAMPRKQSKAAAGGQPKAARVETRYDIRRIANMIEGVRAEEELTMEAFALSVGLPRKQDYEKRRNCKGATWSVEEIGRVANAYGMPVGWPFVTRDEIRALLATVGGDGKIQ